MVAKTDYGRREVEVSHSVLLELIHVLGKLDFSFIKQFISTIHRRLEISVAKIS